MWSLKITTEQRYKYFEPILPDIKADINLFVNTYMKSDLYLLALRSSKGESTVRLIDWITHSFKSFIIERTLDNQYQITFYE